MARILLNKVEQDAFEGRGFGPIPARARSANLRKVMILNDGPTAHGLHPQRACQLVECLPGPDEPTVTPIVAPRTRSPVPLTSGPAHAGASASPKLRMDPPCNSS